MNLSKVNFSYKAREMSNLEITGVPMLLLQLTEETESMDVDLNEIVENVIYSDKKCYLDTGLDIEGYGNFSYVECMENNFGDVILTFEDEYENKEQYRLSGF